MAASACSPPADVRLPVEPRPLDHTPEDCCASPADAECFGSADAVARLPSVESVRVAAGAVGAPSHAGGGALAEIEHEAAESVVSAEDTKVDPALEAPADHVPRLTHAKLSWSDIMRGDIIDTDEAASQPPVVEALPPLPDEPTPGSAPAPKNLVSRLLSCWTCDGKSLSCLRASSSPCGGRPKAR